MTKLALIGCGKHMQTTLISYLHRLDGYQMELCVDVDETAARTAQRLSHANAWTTHINDISMYGIDAAIVALPPKPAYEVTYALIEQGIACFVEKPPASTTEEIRDLYNLARSRNVYVQVGFNFRYADAVAAFQKAIEEYRTQPCNTSLYFRSKHPSGPQWDRDDAVEAWLYHNGIHMLDFVQWTVGDIVHVSAGITPMREHKFILTALTEHRNGSISTLKMGNLVDTFDLKAEVYTQDGTQVNMPHLGEVRLSMQKGKLADTVLYRTRNLDDGWGRSGHGPELKYFLQNYQNSENAVPSLRDALKASQVCDELVKCLRAEKVVQQREELVDFTV